MRRILGASVVVLLVVVVAAPAAADGTAAPRRPAGRPAPGADPVAEIDRAELMAILEQLTSFEPHSGWRNSTTAGEAQAIEWVRTELEALPFLSERGLEMTVEPFETSLGIEIRESAVELVAGEGIVEIPADAPTGHRDLIHLAVRFDSDGSLGDDEPDPVVAEGAPVVIRSAGGIDSATVAGRVVFLDFALVDRAILDINDAVDRAWRLMARGPAAIVMVTEFDNRQGFSHGSFAGDLSAFTWVEAEPRVPVLGMRIEDVRAAGLDGWAALGDVESARVRWDVDVRQPGQSSYLMARLPGLEHGRAVILGAHIDSPNTPGALDDGSGSAALLAVARALDRARVTPPVDLHLVWFGSHERGLYGSATFVTRHSELLDRSIAMVQMDCLSRTLDGMNPDLWLEGWSYGRHGDSRQPSVEAVESLAAGLGVTTRSADVRGLVSDNSSFVGQDVPSMNFIYADFVSPVEVHYGGHLHDPYDEVDTMLPVAPVFEDMARVMASAAVRLGTAREPLRVTPRPDRRALFVASHTASPHMTPAALTELGMTLAWEGFDVDVVPFGTAVTAPDLAASDLVVALPVHDWRSPEGEPGGPDERWTTAEADALEQWVADGGRLVITNSWQRLKYLNLGFEANEDRLDANLLAERFGVAFESGRIAGTSASAVGGHALADGVSQLEMIDGNGVPFIAPGSVPVAASGGEPVVAAVAHGAGEVVVVADLGVLGGGANLRFWRNLAAWAR